jgi:hypothetical protein
MARSSRRSRESSDSEQQDTIAPHIRERQREVAVSENLTVFFSSRHGTAPLASGIESFLIL